MANFSPQSAAAYDRLMGRWSRLLARDFVAFTGLADHDRVLDIGCGTGSLTFAVLAAANVASVDAIDPAPMFVDALRATAGDSRVRVGYGDACDLPFPDSSFNRALSLLVLQFVPDTAQAVREMRRVVRPGGLVAAAVWDSFSGISAIGAPIAEPGALEAAWAAAGLLDIAAATLTIRMPSTARAFACRGVVPPKGGSHGMVP